ncbi:magnesium transporter CorA family protein [Tetragenococcus muriaticus]|uniref:CorA family magnesium/cobalt transporter n=2 Tax=Tetragenococcus muriaticus TaxID=64642 RepID=A0A091C531_9ENTE|nr:magnesium transporter CorA family protein [Tetragenococcus muriaticus]KFN92009.1 CorA family magnesium/cobalt transporter [Tetragenococcus muriaticus 3MR10-3]
MLYYYTFDENYLARQETLKQNTLWIHVEKPSTQEIDTLRKNYHLPKDYLTAVLDDEENSRSEGLNQQHMKKAALLLLQFPYEVQSPSGFQQFETYPLSLIITPENRIITIANYFLPFFQAIKNHYFKPNDNVPEMNIALEILWQVVLSFNNRLKTTKDHLDRLEKQIKVSTQNEQLYQIMDVQKSLVSFDEATSANLDTLKALSNTELIQLKGHHAFKHHLRDVIEETKQSLTSASIQLKFATHMNDTFSSVVSNNLNNVMKILTSITLVLTIPTIISGIYGMNVKLPLDTYHNTFWAIMLVTIIISWIAVKILKKKSLL